MWLRIALLSTIALATACDRAGAPDAGIHRDAGAVTGLDAGGVDAGGRDAGRGGSDAAPVDAGSADALAAHRRRLLDSLGTPVCETWESFDESQRQVFLTLTHRLWLSRTPDGASMLSHLTRLYLVLGGGEDGTACGGGENNRLFLAMDPYLHARMVETWEGGTPIGDGGGLAWIHTRDVAGPHDPFDASDESDSGLRCRAFVIEEPDSRPPTAQAHFFLEGSATPVERGPGISLPADPLMLEIDHDYDCFHRSNPTCRDFAARYVEHYGDYGAGFRPPGC